MTQEISTVNSIQELLDKALFAAASVNAKGEIIYRNKAFTESFGETPPVFEKINREKADKGYIRTDTASYRVYTTPAEDCVIAVFTPCNNDSSELLANLLASNLHTATNIFLAADNIAMEGCSESVAEALNAIESSSMGSLSRTKVIDRILELSDKIPGDFEAVNISDRLNEYAADLAASLAKYPTEVTVSSKGGYFSRCDFKAVALLAADFTARVTDSFKVPESIELKLSEAPADRVMLTVICKLDSSCSPKEAAAKTDLSSECSALSELLAEKCDCTVTEQVLGNDAIFSVNMPQSLEQTVLKAPQTKLKVSPGRFSDSNIMLSARGINPSYSKRKDTENDK